MLPFKELRPGFYQYTYSTFVDRPQQICIHFLTPNQQQAFVSYPKNRKHKAAQLIDLSWFNSVDLVKLDGQPQLMYFLEVILPQWLKEHSANVIPLNSLAAERIQNGINALSIAFG